MTRAYLAAALLVPVLLAALWLGVHAAVRMDLPPPLDDEARAAAMSPLRAAVVGGVPARPIHARLERPLAGPAIVSVWSEGKRVQRVEGTGALQVLWKVYVPLARPVYLAYGLVSVSYHWNNFLWPLIVTNSVGARPVTVGLQVFSSADQGVDWSVITAATLMTSAPLLIAFLLFQRQFVQSFMRAGIR